MSGKLEDRDEKHRDHKKFEITIDKKKFEVEGPTITGAQLRSLPEPDIGDDRDLFLTVAGPAPDLLIEEDKVVTLEKHMVFFTAPRTITPGANAPSG